MVNLEMSRIRNWARILSTELHPMSFIPQITHLTVNPVIIYIFVLTLIQLKQDSGCTVYNGMYWI